MISNDTRTSLENRYRLYFGIAVLAVMVVGFVVVQMNGQTAEDGVTTADKPPIPKTKVELTENKIIKQKALNFDASLKLSAARNEIAAAQNE